MGSIEQRINEDEVFDRTCVRNVLKKPIYKRGPGDSGSRLFSILSEYKMDVFHI